MTDMDTFSRKGSIVQAAFQALEKEGIDFSALSTENVWTPDVYENAAVFGVSLGDCQKCCMSEFKSRSVPVPKFLADAIQFLERYLSIEGIFRKAGSLTRQREMKAHIQAGGSLAEHHKPHDVACLLKLFLRELPDPLLTSCLAPAFAGTSSFTHKKQVECVMLLCLLLPQTHLSCLQVLCQFLHKVSVNSDQNLMDVVNLALVMAPNLLPLTYTSLDSRAHSTSLGYEQCLEATTSVVKILIECYDQIGMVPERVALVAKRLEEECGPGHKWKDIFAERSCETPDGLVTDGSTGDELDSDGDLASSGAVRKKSTKKSRTRTFVHNLGNKLRSRYGNKNSDTKTPNSSPVPKEHVPRIFSHLDSQNVTESSSPLVTAKRKADHDPHLMSASKRQAILQQSIGSSSKLRSGNIFRTPLNMKATKKSILRRCRHTDYGKTRKNAYLMLRPSYSTESLDENVKSCKREINTDSYSPVICNDAVGMTPPSKNGDDFPIVEFSMSASVQKHTNSSKPSSNPENKLHKSEVVSINIDSTIGRRCNFVKSGSVPCQPLKSSVSADNVKYFSVTPDINFTTRVDNEHEKSNPYKFQAKSFYPRSVSAHEGLKSSYHFGSGFNLMSCDVDSRSTQSHVNDKCSKTINVVKIVNNGSSLKKSTSHPAICSSTDRHAILTGNTLQPKLRAYKSSSLSPAKVTGSMQTKSCRDDMQFRFSRPAVVQPVAISVVDVDSPQPYSDVEKDAECSKISSTDEVTVNHLASQDVCKQLFAESEHSQGSSHQKEMGSSSRDNDLFDSPLKNSLAGGQKNCSGLLEEISSDLAEKHRYSPNYVTPFKAAESVSYDKDEILDYTGSPRHCVAVSRGDGGDLSTWKDDYQQSQFSSRGFRVPHSPDPWAKRRVRSTSSHLNPSQKDLHKPIVFSTVKSETTISDTEAVKGCKGTSSACSIENCSVTLPPAAQTQPSAIYRSSLLAKKASVPYIASEPSLYMFPTSKHIAQAEVISTKPSSASFGLNKPKIGTSKATMPNFYKEMVPLSRKTLKNSSNVKTKILRFEGITSQKDTETCGSTDIAGEVRELDCSPQQHYNKVKRSGTWSFHSPAPLQKQQQPPEQGETGRSYPYTHYTFQCPKVKREVIQGQGKLNKTADNCYQQQKSSGTSRSDHRAETTRGIVGRKRSSPVSETGSHKISRSPLSSLHLNCSSEVNQLTKGNSFTRTEHVRPSLSVPRSKENSQQAISKVNTSSEKGDDVGVKQESTSVYNINQFPTTQTVLLREWII